MSDEEFEEDDPSWTTTSSTTTTSTSRTILDDVDDVVVDDVDLLDDELDEASPEVTRCPWSPTTVVDGTTEEEDDEEGVVDLDEELHPDDVEAPLDTLLQERTASATLEDDEEELEEEEGDGDDRADGPARIVPRRPDEFLCQSCFLLLPLRRLADPAAAVLRRLRLTP